ncbi:MAG: phasin [Rhodospirillales bacterium 20-60-12]|nr:MAG: phasin [Rhodospirillales bacterium 20-60-12]HQT67340.1 phasin family protein [Acetobacteraceae bacterium]
MSTKIKTAETAEAVKSAIAETNEAATKGFEKTLAVMKDGVEKATKGIESSQAKMKESVSKAMKTAEEMMAFSQGNIEAIMKSSQIFSAGLQDLSKHVAASSKAHIDESMATMKAISSVKSIKEAMDLQAHFVRTMMEKTVAETGKMTDASVKLTEQAIAPITARVTLAVEKFGKAA